VLFHDGIRPEQHSEQVRQYNICRINRLCLLF
jgi:hypothetical protein